MELRVKIKFYYPLYEYVDNNKDFEVEISKEMSLKKLLCHLGVPLESVGFVTINDTIVTLDYILESDNNIKVFPLINGG